MYKRLFCAACPEPGTVLFASALCGILIGTAVCRIIPEGVLMDACRGVSSGEAGIFSRLLLAELPILLAALLLVSGAAPAAACLPTALLCGLMAFTVSAMVCCYGTAGAVGAGLLLLWRIPGLGALLSLPLSLGQNTLRRVLLPAAAAAAVGAILGSAWTADSAAVLFQSVFIPT